MENLLVNSTKCELDFILQVLLKIVNWCESKENVFLLFGYGSTFFTLHPYYLYYCFFF